MEDMEEDPLATDIPLLVLFANDRLCAQGMGTEEVEATVEDMEEDQSLIICGPCPGDGYGG